MSYTSPRLPVTIEALKQKIETDMKLDNELAELCKIVITIDGKGEKKKMDALGKVIDIVCREKDKKIKDLESEIDRIERNRDLESSGV